MIYNIQATRALAALFVVFAHIGYPGFTFGHFGVDIFFVISGFIMTMICCKNPKSFFLRRLLRIVPLYWLITLLVLLLSYLKPELMNSTTPNLKNLLKSLFFIPYVKENGMTHPMLDVGWTLNYEMYFYLVIAVALRFVKPARATLFAATFMIFIALALRAALALSHGLPYGIVVPFRFYSADVTFEFLFGVGAYYIIHSESAEKFGIGFSSVLAIVCLAVLIGNQLRPFPEYLSPICTVGFPATGFVLAMLLLEKRKFILTKITLLGDASYALYLTNQFVVEGCRKVIFKKIHLPIYSIFGIALILIAASVIAILIFKIIEKPFHDKLRSWV
jgi:exopolysaccharide production protein ExoZ